MSEVAGIKAELTQNLRHLHLPTIRECYEEVARQAERETLSYERYLHEVVQRECDERLENRNRQDATRVTSAAGEVAGNVRCPAPATQSSPANANAAGRWFSGTYRKRVGIR